MDAWVLSTSACALGYVGRVPEGRRRRPSVKRFCVCFCFFMISFLFSGVLLFLCLSVFCLFFPLPAGRRLPDEEFCKAITAGKEALCLAEKRKEVGERSTRERRIARARRRKDLPRSTRGSRRCVPLRRLSSSCTCSRAVLSSFVLCAEKKRKRKGLGW